MASNNDLPPLPAWYARSFYAALLAALVTVLKLFGVDLLAKLHMTSSQALDAFETILPLALLLWAWLERRAPKFRLVLRRVMK